MLQEVERTDDLERDVKLKKSLQQILLIPKPDAPRNPVFRIISRAEYIVNMYENARISYWQYFEVLE